MQNFQEEVLAVVKRIPKGKTLSYAEVALRAGNSLAYRAVGNIMNANYHSHIPCHRVIRSDGSVGGFNRGTRKKLQLLQEEGALS